MKNNPINIIGLIIAIIVGLVIGYYIGTHPISADSLRGNSASHRQDTTKGKSADKRQDTKNPSVDTSPTGDTVIDSTLTDVDQNSAQLDDDLTVSGQALGQN